MHYVANTALAFESVEHILTSAWCCTSTRPLFESACAFIGFVSLSGRSFTVVVTPPREPKANYPVGPKLSPKFIEDPVKYRPDLRQFKEPGIYVFTNKITGRQYVGSSANLYRRISSYFKPSDLAKNEQRQQ